MTLTKKDFINQLSQLVSLRTLTSDQTENGRALDYIVSLLDPGLDIQRIKNERAEILIASTSRTSTPEIGYLVHVDVVAASDQLFKLQEKDGIIKGRGVSDMKFSIPLGVALINEVLKTKDAPVFSLVVTTDEETGGYDGAGFLAQSIAWKPQVLIVPDGGDNLKFVKASKGVAQLRVTASGTSAHASRPWQGENAIPKIAKLIQVLEKKYGGNNQAQNWKTTLNFGKINGGISTNQVCDQVSLELDFRYPETDTLERIEAEVKDLMTLIDESMTLQRLSTGLPTATDPQLPVVKDFLQVLRQCFGQEIQIEPNFGASDARHFAPFGIPILMIKPVGGDIHMESEWLDLASTMTFYEALRAFVLRKRTV